MWAGIILLINYLVVLVTGPPPYLGTITGTCGDCTDPGYRSAIIMVHYTIADGHIHYYQPGYFSGYVDGAPTYTARLRIIEDEWDTYSWRGCIDVDNIAGVVLPREDESLPQVMLTYEPGKVQVCEPDMVFFPIVGR